MVAPIVAAAARLAGSAITKSLARQGLSTTEARKAAASTIKAAATNAAKKAASAERKAITNELKAKGLTGAERIKWREDNKGLISQRIADARANARADYRDMLVGAKQTGSAITAATATRIAGQFMQGDTVKAVSTARAAASSALNRARKMYEAEGVEILPDRITGKDREKTLTSIMSRMSGGMTAAQAAREVTRNSLVINREKAGPMTGPDVYNLWKELRKKNNYVRRIMNIPSMRPSQQDAAMSHLGFIKVNGEWQDAKGHVWTPEDVIAVTRDELDIVTATRFRYGPSLSLNYVKNEVGKFPRSLSKTWLDSRVRSFATSFQSAGIDTEFPVTYGLIMDKLSKATPSLMKRIIEDGTVANVVTFFQSDRDGVVVELEALLIELGIRQEDIPEVERGNFTSSTENRAYWDGTITAEQRMEAREAKRKGKQAYADKLGEWNLIPETYIPNKK